MRNHLILHLNILLSGAIFMACSQEALMTTNFQTICEGSGGKYQEKDELCQCGRTLCDPGVVCGKDKTCLDQTHYCEPNKPKCEDDVYYICKSIPDDDTLGTWEKQDKPCPDHCTERQFKCDGTTYYACIVNDEYPLGKWVKQDQKCPEPFHCDENNTQCQNVDGYGFLIQCQQNAESKDNPYAITVNACQNHASCKNDNECGDCKDGEKQCDNSDGIGKLRTCSNGSWETKSCGEGILCIDNACNECKTGTTKCTTESATGVSSIQRCMNGKWNSSQECGKGLSCKDDGATCGECIEGSFRCAISADIAVSEKCIDGVFQSDYRQCDKACSDPSACQGTIDDYIFALSNNELKQSISIIDAPNGNPIPDFSLENFSHVKVYGIEDNWCHINNNGKAAYIECKYLTKIDTANNPLIIDIIEKSNKYLYTTDNKCCTYDHNQDNGTCPHLEHLSSTLFEDFNCPYLVHGASYIHAILMAVSKEYRKEWGSKDISFANGEFFKDYIKTICEEGKSSDISKQNTPKSGDIIWNAAANRFVFVVGNRLYSTGPVQVFLGSFDFFTDENPNPCKRTLTDKDCVRTSTKGRSSSKWFDRVTYGFSNEYKDPDDTTKDYFVNYCRLKYQK